MEMADCYDMGFVSRSWPFRQRSSMGFDAWCRSFRWSICGSVLFPLQGFVCPSGSRTTTPEPSITTPTDPLTTASSRSTAAGGVMTATLRLWMHATSGAAVSDEPPHLNFTNTGTFSLLLFHCFPCCHQITLYYVKVCWVFFNTWRFVTSSFSPF